MRPEKLTWRERIWGPSVHRLAEVAARQAAARDKDVRAALSEFFKGHMGKTIFAAELELRAMEHITKRADQIINMALAAMADAGSADLAVQLRHELNRQLNDVRRDLDLTLKSCVNVRIKTEETPTP